MERNWLKNYPEGVAPHLKANEYASLVELLNNSFTKYAELPAYKFMGKDYSYAHIDEMSRAFGPMAWGAALVLILIVLVLNLLARVLGKIFAPKSGH